MEFEKQFDEIEVKIRKRLQTYEEIDKTVHEVKNFISQSIEEERKLLKEKILEVFDA